VTKYAASKGAVDTLCGIAGALAMSRWIASLLFGFTSRDPVSFAISVVVLVGVCVVAGYVPLRTAAGTDAAQALKLE
jgi:ABC-type antimicrobial peptide transport system permease subunit